LSDGWDTDPFTLTIDKATGRLIGRGSSDDKGPVLGWVNILEAHKTLGLELPVNLKFCFEGMEESGSEGLDDLINNEVKKGKDGWFEGVDCVCIVSETFPLSQVPSIDTSFWICSPIITGSTLVHLRLHTGFVDLATSS
jgi:Cys-Gly metallodipeptidase DUG1